MPLIQCRIYICYVVVVFLCASDGNCMSSCVSYAGFLFLSILCQILVSVTKIYKVILLTDVLDLNDLRPVLIECTVVCSMLLVLLDSYTIYIEVSTCSILWDFFSSLRVNSSFYYLPIYFAAWDYDKTANINLQCIVIIPIYFLLPHSIQVFCFKAFRCYEITFFFIQWFLLLLEISKDISSANDFYSKGFFVTEWLPYTVTTTTKSTNVRWAFLSQLPYNSGFHPPVENAHQ